MCLTQRCIGLPTVPYVHLILEELQNVLSHPLLGDPETTSVLLDESSSSGSVFNGISATEQIVSEARESTTSEGPADGTRARSPRFHHLLLEMS